MISRANKSRKRLPERGQYINFSTYAEEVTGRIEIASPDHVIARHKHERWRFNYRDLFWNDAQGCWELRRKLTIRGELEE